MLAARGGLVFRQLFESTSSTFTYLLGCAASREALLIDPCDVTVDRDLSVVRELGLRLVTVLNTHVHADHVSGSGLLKQRAPPPLRSAIAAAAGAARGRAAVTSSWFSRPQGHTFLIAFVVWCVRGGVCGGRVIFWGGRCSGQ